MGRVRSVLAALLGTAFLAVPLTAAAQDFGMGFFNDSIDLTNAYVAQSAMASVANVRPLTTPPPTAIDRSVMEFERDLEVSARVRERFRDQLIRSNPDRAADIATALERNWLREFAYEMALNGLDADNLADANTAYLIASWALVNNVEFLDPRAILSVRNSMRAAISNSPDVIAMSNADKQIAAETLIYNTVLVMANRVQIAATRDSALHAAAAKHYGDGFRELGIDLKALQLTNHTFVSIR
ncbi:DUF6683 family protein [Devosia sp. SD17-2]|uniref:DUF6683 family protein n=1 Tax=Devosia sp. SD17-2 TaxID=2976459 RepID=UPI0023D864E0|nr:DUF6683 family protein [Devosia sp. SD17-2]WEJ31521.1 hypothetical protein NYQ88_11405 [Devosia sp. SD17-2]